MGTGGRDIEREEQREEGECPQAKRVQMGGDCKVEWLGGRERKRWKEEMSIKTQASIHTQKGSGSALTYVHWDLTQISFHILPLTTCAPDNV